MMNECMCGLKLKIKPREIRSKNEVEFHHVLDLKYSVQNYFF